ncbi:GIY-YIG nuclease family protein [Nostoc sp. FACHB-145]|uniref:GIY-YIG nuclease family protein n=1 Tax=Nostoc sp. FACHB-145 TaxID=2692836 RepID=UPI00168A2785|nr:GIY-YIG nuclease family protein [Nostoc sp. FACHB-145]MBD2471708.1 GIY-YIG nuclease family protein [Nostoc sp. FACHB-145]
MINPSSTSLELLPCVPFDLLKNLPSIPCVYFCLNQDGMPVYIGETGNLYKRWEMRCHPKKLECKEEGCCKLAWIEVLENSHEVSPRRCRLVIERSFIRQGERRVFLKPLPDKDIDEKRG